MSHSEHDALRSLLDAVLGGNTAPSERRSVPEMAAAAVDDEPAIDGMSIS